MIPDNIFENNPALAEAFRKEPDNFEVLSALGRLGMDHAEQATAITAPLETVRRWYEGDRDDMQEYEDKIEDLKAVTCFTLVRGVLPAKLAILWLTEFNQRLEARPIDILTEEKGLEAVISASTTFTRPEPRRHA